MALASLVGDLRGNNNVIDIISFAESPNYLDIKLFPIQRVILKILYQIPLSDDISDDPIIIKDKFNEEVLHTFYSEKYFVDWLYENEYINSNEFDPDLTEVYLIIGRRGTKTTLSSIITCYTLFTLLSKESPHDYLGIIKQSEIGVAICSNNRDNAERQLREVSAMVFGSKWFKPFLISDEPTSGHFFLQTREQMKNPEKKIGKLRVAVFAASPSVRGSANIVVIMDEYAHFIDAEASTKAKPLDKMLYEALTPSVSGFSDPDGRPAGKAIIITSPNGKRGEVWKKKNETKNDKSTLFLNIPSWWSNPTISSVFLRKMYYSSENSFWQEYGAKFVERQSNWIMDFNKFRAMRDVSLPNSLYNGVPGKRYYLGVDLAIKNDGVALSVVSYSQHRERQVEDPKYLEIISNTDVYAVEYVWYLLPEKGQIIKPRVVFDAIEEIKHHYRIVDSAFDQWSYELFSDYMEREGIVLPRKKISATVETNSNMAAFFKSLMNEGRIILPNDDGLFEELELLKERISGRYIKVENTSGHDDRFTSILRAIWLCKNDPLKGRSETKKITAKNYKYFKDVYHKPLQHIRKREGRKWRISI